MYKKHLQKVSKHIIFLLAINLCLGCGSDDDNEFSPLSALPLITTTGENTIGCMIGNEPFTDSGEMVNTYKLIDGEYFLTINWQESTLGNLKSGQISIKRTEVIEGQSYFLKLNSEDEDYSGGSAKYTYTSNDNFIEYRTNLSFYGIIHFTRFDNLNNIMSGTFQFNAKEFIEEEPISGEVIYIDEGRFDLTFTN